MSNRINYTTVYSLGGQFALVIKRKKAPISDNFRRSPHPLTQTMNIRK